jgi:type II secretory pathway pseudopilin PulG
MLAALTTGAVAFGTVAATGAVTGVAARATAERDLARQQQQARAAAQALAAYKRAVQVAPARQVVVVTKTRPQRTVVHTHVVHRVSSAGVAQVGTGWPVTQSVGTSAPAAAPVRSQSSASSSHHTAAPPPPPPPPAPSSGS